MHGIGISGEPTKQQPLWMPTPSHLNLQHEPVNLKHTHKYTHIRIIHIHTTQQMQTHTFYTTKFIRQKFSLYSNKVPIFLNIRKSTLYQPVVILIAILMVYTYIHPLKYDNRLQNHVLHIILIYIYMYLHIYTAHY